IEAYRKGKSLAEEYLARNPRDALVQSYLAYLYARLAEPDRAAFEAARAAGLSPDNMLVKWVLALTYEALSQREHTLSVLLKAPKSLLDRCNRFPDLADLRNDSRFHQLLAAPQSQ